MPQYDCRGQGQSGHPDGPYSMEQHAFDLEALLTTLGVERAHILEVAQAFALGPPSRVRSLILADTVGEVGPELRLIVEAWRDRAAASDADGLFATSAPWNFSAEYLAEHPEIIAAARQRYRLLMRKRARCSVAATFAGAGTRASATRAGTDRRW